MSVGMVGFEVVSDRLIRFNISINRLPDYVSILRLSVTDDALTAHLSIR